MEKSDLRDPLDLKHILMRLLLKDSTPPLNFNTVAKGQNVQP